MTNKQTAAAYCLRVMNDSVWLCADCVDRFRGSTNEERAELLVAWTPEGIDSWSAHRGWMDQIPIKPRQPRKTCRCRGCWTVFREK